MENRFLNMEKIDRYINGQLSDDENAEMRQRIAEDESFRKLFDDMEIITDGIRKSAASSSVEEKLAKLKETIHLEEDTEIEESTHEGIADEEEQIRLEPTEIQYPQAGKTIVLGFPVAEIINRYKIAIAAAVSLVVVAWFALNPFGTLSGPELFAEHFEPYPNVIGMTRGADQQQVDQRTAAYMAYDQGDYAQAVEVFGKILPESDDQTLDLFYLGNAYLAIGNNEKAVAAFKEVVEAQTGLTINAKWYLGLSYLNSGELESAKEVFGELAELGKDYSEDAEEILDNLD